MQHRDKAEKVDRLIAALINRPMYIISYAGSRQESFGHHLAEMAQSGYLYEIVYNTYRTQLPKGVRKTARTRK